MPGSGDLRVLLIGLAVVFAVTLLRDACALRAPRASGRFAGEIGPSARLVLLTCAGGLGMAAAAFWTTYTTHAGPAVAVIGALSLVGAMIAACNIHPDRTIRWTVQGVEGPATSVPFPTGSERVEFAWESVTRTGRDALGFYVQNASGTRIRWNASYGGHAQLMAAVEHNCAHLFPVAHAGT
jgi:hypothetical protein